MLAAFLGHDFILCLHKYDPNHPHAVASMTTPTGATRTFSYDADGNLLTESGAVNRQVTWTSYNKPSQIVGDGATETFLYGPDRSRLVTAITRGSDNVTTTYIDGLFEQVYDSATGDLTYRHYILAGGARVGVETIAADSGGTITADTLSFYVHDEVGSVMATVTENLGGANQSVTLTSYDAWGKARPTTGISAYQDPAPGTFYSPTPSGQNEGFAGHENLTDVCLVNMEGRMYDPDLGRFLSADPNVQYPFSSQGYDRYAYVDNNPLSLTDPTGYFAEAVLGEVISDIGPFLSTIQPFCGVWCTAAAEAVGGYMQSGNNVGTGLEAGTLSLASSESMNAIGSYYGASPSGAYVGGMSAAEALASKTLVEGLVLGALSEAGGGRFGSGFLGGVTGSLVGSFLNSPAFTSLNDPGKINYIEAGAEAVAADTFTVGGTPSPAETVSYFYHDEIGSVEVTSDGSGGSLARYAYSAWGKARPVAGTGAYVPP